MNLLNIFAIKLFMSIELTISELNIILSKFKTKVYNANSAVFVLLDFTGTYAVLRCIVWSYTVFSSIIVYFCPRNTTLKKAIGPLICPLVTFFFVLLLVVAVIRRLFFICIWHTNDKESWLSNAIYRQSLNQNHWILNKCYNFGCRNFYHSILSCSSSRLNE